MRRTHVRLALALAVARRRRAGRLAGTRRHARDRVVRLRTPEMFDGLAALDADPAPRGIASTTRSHREGHRAVLTGALTARRRPASPRRARSPSTSTSCTRSDGTGNVSQADVEEQIEVLNITFGG